MAGAVDEFNRSVPGATVRGRYVTTSELDARSFAEEMVAEGGASDGVVVVAREHPAMNRAVRVLVGGGTPVVCLTTDLPSSRRSTYVGNDQYAAGSVAGQLIGKALPRAPRQILLAMSEPFRCQQEREMGFRRVLRASFPHLRIDERVIADDVPDTAYEGIMRYIEGSGTPSAVYNVAGANRGIARALEQANEAAATIFVGHELTPRSRGAARVGDHGLRHLPRFRGGADVGGPMDPGAPRRTAGRAAVLAHPGSHPLQLRTMMRVGGVARFASPRRTGRDYAM